MAQIFISYSRKDLSFIERLAADLKNAGFDVWYDLASLGGGSRWGREIEAAIKKSRYVIVVLSPASVASEWVEREFLFASNRKRKIIPLLYRPCELPINYLDLNYIDVQGENYEKNFGELLEALDVDPTKLSSPAQVEPSKLPFGFPARHVALIGTVATFLVVAGIFLFNSWPPPQPLPMETTPPVVMTFASSTDTPTGPTPTEASPTPSPTPTNTATPTNTPSPTPTNTATLITPTTEPSLSAYTTVPPSVDGFLSITYKDEWKGAHVATTLPLGNLYYLNDDQYLYLLVDVVQDTHNDLYLNGVLSEKGDKSYDDLTIGFDVNQDNKQDFVDVYYKYSGRDATFKSFIWSDIDQKGCGAKVTDLPTLSEGVSGFDISPEFKHVSHRFWELKIALEDIQGKLGENVYAGVFVARYEKRPFTFEDSVPKGFGFDGFCTYDKPIEIYLYDKPSDL